MGTVSQKSFAGGEIAPSVYARVDLVKYATGLRTLRNFFVMRHGGAANRPGSEFVAEIKDSTRTVRFIPFIFNSSQTYLLEFGEKYMRVHRNGAQLTDLSLTITGITNANPGVVTYTGTDPVEGQEVFISGVAGGLGNYLNGRNFKVGTVNGGANTFQLKKMDGTNFTTVGLGTYTSGGTADRVYEIATVYQTADLATLNYVQSADVITIVHPNYAPRELARTGHTSWAFSVISFAPLIAAPSIGTPTGGAAGIDSNYVVTSLDPDTFEESLPSAVGSISSKIATSASPISVPWTNVTGVTTYSVYKALNGVYGFIGVASGTPFSDIGYIPDTEITPPQARNPFGLEAATNISGATAANPVVVTSASHGLLTGDTAYITGITGMTELNGNHYKVTVLSSSTFSLQDFNGDNIDGSAYTAYVSGGTVAQAGNYPSTVSYFQQRRIFANTDNDPEKVWGSRTGQFTNFTTSSPLQDDDSVSFNLAGRQVNEVKYVLDLGKLLLLTSGGEWVAAGDVAGILSPTEVNSRQYSYNGSGDLSPIVVGENALYIQARGTVIRDLGYDYQVDGYRGNDLTIFSAHLFDEYTLLDWSYQQIPHSIVWIIRSDGSLIGLTYIRDHQVFGWHRHDFDGSAENVCSVPEGNEDVIYVLVKRTINGEEKRYIERIASRLVQNVADCKFMDACLTYDGRNDDESHTMTLSGGTTWAYTETITLTSSASFFSASDVGNEIHLTSSDGDLIRFQINTYSSATVVTGKPHKTVPASLRSVATSDWTKAVDELHGLWHIEGKDVSVLGDGFVVASPNNESYDVLTVTNGGIELDKPYGVIHVGLPITADIETLDIDTPNGETLADKKKIVSKVTVHVEDSRGIWIGPDEPTNDAVDPLEGLSELKIRNEESYDDPVALATGTVEVNIQPEWNSNGRVFLRQVDPVPLAVLAISPAGLFPFRRGGE